MIMAGGGGKKMSDSGKASERRKEAKIRRKM